MSVSIFLSHASEDNDQVEDLYERLEEEGLDPWMDTKDLLGGEDWERGIWRAVHGADFFVFCLTEHAVGKRGFLQREIKRAQEEWEGKLQDDIYFIPLRLEQCEPSESIKGKFHWIDLFKNDGFDRLLQSLQRGAERRGLAWPGADQREISEPNVVVATYAEEKDGEIPYSIDISYPRIEGPDAEWKTELNRRLEGFAMERLHAYRKRYLTSLHDEELGSMLGATGVNQVSISHNATLFDDNLLSVAFSVAWYGAGAAHGNTHNRTLNFQIEPTLPLDLADLFHDRADYLPRLSELCVIDLEEQSKQYGSDETAYKLMDDPTNRSGTAPEKENFKHFHLSDEALHILFDKYQVGPGAWGCREVSIPYHRIGDILDSTGPLKFVLSK
jgi:hypothetical protein